MDYIVHGVTKSRTRLSNFHFTALLGFPVAQLVKNRPAREGTLVQSWVRKFPWRNDRLPTLVFLGFPSGSDGKKKIHLQCRRPGFGISPGGGHGSPFQCSCLENPYGQRSLVSYSPWGHKESDKTERLSTAQHFYRHRALLWTLEYS